MGLFINKNPLLAFTSHGRVLAISSEAYFSSSPPTTTPINSESLHHKYLELADKAHFVNVWKLISTFSIQSASFISYTDNSTLNHIINKDDNKFICMNSDLFFSTNK
jgi:hypothetical protein